MKPPDPRTPRLEAYEQLSRTPLDLLALLTIWLTILPLTGATDTSGWTPWTLGRLALSTVYGIDLGIRLVLSGHPVAYMRHHRLAWMPVVLPATRILFSLRLLHRVFRQGALGYFLFVATMFVLNGVVLVYAFEVDAPGANIVSLADALWWACVTVATVGYGDYYPVSMGGKITAVALMALGLVTAAVITAQIASAFLDQAAARRQALAAGGDEPEAGSDPDTDPLLVQDGPSVHERLDRIEALLRSASSDE